jgi:hypothetical protein
MMVEVKERAKSYLFSLRALIRVDASPLRRQFINRELIPGSKGFRLRPELIDTQTNKSGNS